MKFIGDRMVRKEDPRLLKGGGRYLGDLTPPGTAHAAFVRSPHANARVRRMNTDRARRMPGVVAIVSFDDLGPAARELPCAPLHPLLTARNFHLLAPGRARFVGEAVAVVVADSRYTAEDAAEVVDAEWEVMASVQDPTATGGGCVHDDIPDNIAGRVTLRHRDVEAALRRAPRTLSERFVVSRGGGQPLEPRGVLAAWDATADLLTIWASSQVPHQIRQFVCLFLGLAQHQVRVLAPDVGGGFGAKLIVYPEDVLVPWLAVRLGVPVKWQEDRLEHMRTATQERVQVHEVTAGFDEQGRILALRDHFVHDTGPILRVGSSCRC